MDFIAGKTSLFHKIFGSGLFVEDGPDYIVVDFEKYGKKKLDKSILENGVLIVDEQQDDSSETTLETDDSGHVKEFEDSDSMLKDRNVALSGSFESEIYVSESFVFLGDLKAPKIYACYDLTVLGELETLNLEVNGDLYVEGSIKADKLRCEKSVICKGKFDVSSAIIGGSITANEIDVEKVVCGENMLVQTIINVERECQAEGMLLAPEGILGQGDMTVRNAVAGDYFDFHGCVTGEIIDLSTEDSIQGMSYQDDQAADPDSVDALYRKVIEEELKKAGEIDEERLKEITKKISNDNRNFISYWGYLLDQLVEISYKKEIDNLKDYILTKFTEKFLPKEITHYETLEHVYSMLLPETETRIRDLSFSANNLQDLSMSISIVNDFPDLFLLPKEEIMDRIFQSIGLKYGTVKSFLKE